MMNVLKANDRGGGSLGWLDTRHSFSFGRYYDTERMGFRALRVINEDRVAPGAGFPEHGHNDMEIISYVLEGGLRHQDSAGHGGVIRPGGFQYMSAGTGIQHSEMNASRDEPVHFYQIWILPGGEGFTPQYGERVISELDKENRLALVAAPGSENGAFPIRQDGRLYIAALTAGAEVTHMLEPERHAWLQVTRGNAALNGTVLAAGDGAGVSGETELRIASESGGEVLLFDLA